MAAVELEEGLKTGSSADGLERPPQPQRHYFEHAVSLHRPLPDHIREGFVHHGVCGAGSHELPWLLAAVEGRDPEDRPFRWVARRARKRLLHPHQLSRPLPPIDWLGWLDARRHWRKLGWWIAVFYTLGSILFVISGVGGEMQPVVEDDQGLRSPFAAFVAWPSLIAANLCFFPAGWIQIVESINMDWVSRQERWEAGGRRGPQPRHHLRPHWADFRTVSLWASAIQLTGMLGFNVATIFAWLGTFRAIQEPVQRWTVNFGFTYGGAAFTASGWLFCLEATGSWWRGVVPTRASDLRCISWHAAFWNLHGSIGFLIGGAATYATGFSWMQLQWVNGYGNLGGAVWFLLAALCAALEQANPGRS